LFEKGEKIKRGKNRLVTGRARGANVGERYSLLLLLNSQGGTEEGPYEIPVYDIAGGSRGTGEKGGGKL